MASTNRRYKPIIINIVLIVVSTVCVIIFGVTLYPRQAVNFYAASPRVGIILYGLGERTVEASILLGDEKLGGGIRQEHYNKDIKDRDGFNYEFRLPEMIKSDGESDCCLQFRNTELYRDYGIRVDRCKLLLRFPEDQTVLVTSDIIDVINLTYTIDLMEYDFSAGQVNYIDDHHVKNDLIGRIISLIFRVATLVDVSVLIARFFFKIRDQKGLCVVVSVNIVFQFLACFFCFDMMARVYTGGPGALSGLLLLWLASSTAGAILYALLFDKKHKYMYRCTAYSFVSNLVTVILGMILAEVLPVLFP